MKSLKELPKFPQEWHSEDFEKNIKPHYPHAKMIGHYTEHGYLIQCNGKPYNWPCKKCGEIMPQAEMWGGGWLHNKCAEFKRWIGISDGKTEWNARFVLGDLKAESLGDGEIISLGNPPKKWRVKHG